jgi:predicted nucleotidyltransferase
LEWQQRYHGLRGSGKEKIEGGTPSLAFRGILEKKTKYRKKPVDQITLLNRIKTLLEPAFGSRLRGVVLYGSEALGEATPDSDIDVLVLLPGPIALGRDLRTIIHALYSLQLEVERPPHAMPVDVEVYEAGEFALYRNAKKEGIFA